jgi:hypothetical protein
MKEYKPVGRFYDDIAMLQNLYGIKLHPCLKEPTLPPSDDEAVADDRKAKEPTSLTFNKYRIDFNSMKLLFKVLEGC